jgi:hypothetical protein
MGLDLLASALLVWAITGLKSRPLRWGLAVALFGSVHLFGGWQREPKELAFSLSVVLCLLSLGVHARSLMAFEGRRQCFQRSASWAHYWSSQMGNLSRQVAFEGLSVLSLLAWLAVEALLIRSS